MSRHAHADRPRTAAPSPALSPDRAGGQALDGPTNARMSARFGHDFASVRIHTDSRAGEAADALGASAFALGGDIVFGGGQFQPGSPQTERTLAHELAHVVQQARFGPGDPARASERGDASEREAEDAAARVTAGQSFDVRSAPGAAVARHPLAPTASDPISFGPFDPATSALPNLASAPPGPMNVGWQYPQNGGGPYAYGNTDRFGASGATGLDFGAGIGVSGSRSTPGLGGTGLHGSISGDFGVGLRGNLGAWNAGSPEENRYGFRLNGMGVPGVTPGATATGSLGDSRGRSVGFDAQGMTYGAEASVGGDGATLGGGVTLGAAAVSASDGVEAVRAGLSAGPSLAGRLHWGLGRDGHRNYGVGADIGPFSGDFTTNDPVRTLARHVLDPTQGSLADSLLPDGNTTDQAIGLAGDAYNAGSQFVSDAYHDLAGTATRAYNGVTGAASSVYNAGAGVASSAYNGVTGAASRVWNSLPDLKVDPSAMAFLP